MMKIKVVTVLLYLSLLFLLFFLADEKFEGVTEHTMLGIAATLAGIAFLLSGGKDE
jgi:hypothetical protein